MSSSKRKIFLFLLLLILAFCGRVSASTLITQKGTVAVTATSGTFSSTCNGCLEILMAARSASTTAPSLPAGWTTITTNATASGGTTAAARFGCKFATGTGDTGTGTWTNATAIVGRSYSGVNNGATADCAKVAIGAGFQTANAKTSTTASFTGITLDATDGSSYVASFLYGSGSSLCTPTGMTSYGTSGTVDGLDTNGGLSSWSTQTCSVTSETWITGEFELKSIAAIPTTYVVDRWSGVPTSGNAVSALKGSKNNPTLSGNALLVFTQWQDTASVTGTVTDENSDSYTNVKQADDGSVTSTLWCSMATTGTQHPVVNFSGGAGTTTFVFMDVIEVNGITNCTADVTSSATGVGANPIQAGSFTTTAANDFIVQFSADRFTTPPVIWSSGPSPWTLALVDAEPAGSGVGAPTAVQVQVQASAGAINPTMYESTPGILNTIAAAFKTSATGTAPTKTPRIVASQNQYGSTGAGPWTSQLPTVSGDMVGIFTLNSPTCDFPSISDLYGNTWTKRTAATLQGSFGTLTSWDSIGALGGENYSATTANCTNGGGGASNWTVFEMTGSGTYDTAATTTGTQSSGGNFDGVTITPSHPNGIIIWLLGDVSNTIIAIAANGTFICAVPTPPASTNDPQCDNGGIGSYNNSGTSAVTVTWTSDAAISGWGSTATSYNNAVIPSTRFTLVGVGP